MPFALGPLTVAGVTGVAERDHGAASGLANVARQLGGALGLGVLVVVFAAAEDRLLAGHALLAHRIDAAITGAAVLLAVALGCVFALIVLPQAAARVASRSTCRTGRSGGKPAGTRTIRPRSS